jgi:hypothetical protein
LEIVTVRHHLAVLDEAGLIITVNKAWRQFADANGLAWDDYGVGRNYLEVCEFAEGDNAIEAGAALKGILGVMTNRQDEWSLEYPCIARLSDAGFLCMYSDMKITVTFAPR